MANILTSFATVISDSTVVEHLTHNSQVDGSNPATSMVRWRMAKILTYIATAISSSTVVKHLTHNPQIDGSNPTTIMVR
jgi:hypothetical protein